MTKQMTDQELLDYFNCPPRVESTTRMTRKHFQFERFCDTRHVMRCTEAEFAALCRRWLAEHGYEEGSSG